MIIKNTHHDYSLNIVHHDMLGHLFLGMYDPDKNQYPAMHLRRGEVTWIYPSELLGSYLYEDIHLQIDWQGN